MAKQRSYKLLCPIARALDKVGDRWTLLILRDLHAGPARFTDLQEGLTGIAANLLTDRLGKLVDDGLVNKGNGPHGSTLYELTELGHKTGDVIFELAMLGARFPSVAEPVRPGNLRTVAVTLSSAAKRVNAGDLEVVASLEVDGEAFELCAGNGSAAVTYGAAVDPDVTLETRYTDLMALSEGEITEQAFLDRYCEITIHRAGTEQALFQLFGLILNVLRGQGGG
ncbi:MAG: helix-turn-helix domain-containing protein [Pseudomonadota bacterium]